MNQTNFLIGRGHLLTHDIDPPRRKPSKKEAYSLKEAVERLAPEFEATAAVLDELLDGDDLQTVLPGQFVKLFAGRALAAFGQHFAEHAGRLKAGHAR